MSTEDNVAPFGKQLAANDKKTRDKAVQSLTIYLSAKKDLTHLELLKLWKGLFYCFWMSDKPLVQQALADSLASLVLKVPRECVTRFLRAFWEIICIEWHGIDRYRLDKYYLLIRKFVLNSFKMLSAYDWDLSLIEEYTSILSNGPLHPTNPKIPDGIRYHLADIYLEELERCIPASESDDVPTCELLVPFFGVLAESTNPILFRKVTERVFGRILEQFLAEVEYLAKKDESDDGVHNQDDFSEDERNFFGYDMDGIKRVLFMTGANPNTVEINRRNIYKLHQSFADVLPNLEDGNGVMDMDLEDGEVQDDDEDNKSEDAMEVNNDEGDMGKHLLLEEEVVKDKKRKKKKKKNIQPEAKKNTVKSNGKTVEIMTITEATATNGMEDENEWEMDAELPTISPSAIKRYNGQLPEQLDLNGHIESDMKKKKKQKKKSQSEQNDMQKGIIKEPHINGENIIHTPPSKIISQRITTPGTEPNLQTLTPGSSGKKKVQWGLENNTVRRFHKIIPITSIAETIVSLPPKKSALRNMSPTSLDSPSLISSFSEAINGNTTKQVPIAVEESINGTPILKRKENGTTPQTPKRAKAADFF